MSLLPVNDAHIIEGSCFSLPVHLQLFGVLSQAIGSIHTMLDTTYAHGNIQTLLPAHTARLRNGLHEMQQSVTELIGRIEGNVS